MRLNPIGSINGLQPLVEGQSSVTISVRHTAHGCVCELLTPLMSGGADDTGTLTEMTGLEILKHAVTEVHAGWIGDAEHREGEVEGGGATQSRLDFQRMLSDGAEACEKASEDWREADYDHAVRAVKAVAGALSEAPEYGAPSDGTGQWATLRLKSGKGLLAPVKKLLRDAVRKAAASWSTTSSGGDEEEREASARTEQQDREQARQEQQQELKELVLGLDLLDRDGRDAAPAVLEALYAHELFTIRSLRHLTVSDLVAGGIRLGPASEIVEAVAARAKEEALAVQLAVQERQRAQSYAEEQEFYAEGKSGEPGLAVWPTGMAAAPPGSLRPPVQGALRHAPRARGSLSPPPLGGSPAASPPRASSPRARGSQVSSPLGGSATASPLGNGRTAATIAPLRQRGDGALAEEDDGLILADAAEGEHHEEGGASIEPSPVGSHHEGARSAWGPNSRQLKALIKIVATRIKGAEGAVRARLISVGVRVLPQVAPRNGSGNQLATEWEGPRRFGAIRPPGPGEYLDADVRRRLEEAVYDLRDDDGEAAASGGNLHTRGSPTDAKNKTTIDLDSMHGIAITAWSGLEGVLGESKGFLRFLGLVVDLTANTDSVCDIADTMTAALVKQLRMLRTQFNRQHHSPELPGNAHDAAQVVAHIFDEVATWLNSPTMKRLAGRVAAGDRRDYMEQMLASRVFLSIDSMGAPEDIGAGLLHVPLLRGGPEVERFLMGFLHDAVLGSNAFQERCAARDVFGRLGPPSGGEGGGARGSNKTPAASGGRGGGARGPKKTPAAKRPQPPRDAVSVTPTAHKDAGRRKAKVGALISDKAAIARLGLSMDQMACVAAIGLPNHDFSADRLWRPAPGEPINDTRSLKAWWVDRVLLDWTRACEQGGVDPITALAVGSTPGSGI